MADTEFVAASGDNAEKTYPIRAGEVKKGMTVMLKGFPCKVIEVTTSKTGKHGHAKANITGLDIFTNKKYIDISPTSHNMVAPFVTVSSYSLTDISEDGYCSVMDDAGEMREDLKLPSGEVGESITKEFEDGKEVVVMVTKAMESEVITSFKLEVGGE
mmetsp:Transcript_62928/g.137880  ORF Transcript_62928/g.137880 Transcript_62928/m.137880 type:complete len:158 (+) Transcript_62928:75-548(+)